MTALAPAIDVRPCAVAHAVASAGDVDHVASATWRTDTIVRLLIGQHNDAILRLGGGIECRTEPGSAVTLACLHRIAQGKATTRREMRTAESEKV